LAWACAALNILTFCCSGCRTLKVADVAASVQCALDLGGGMLMHAKDDDGKSQWAVTS